jgi:Mg/Co/Ni transporter MgtE
VRGFSVVGFIVGAICALILFAVATALVSLRHEDLIFGLTALALWAWMTFAWPRG